ncbi:MAG: conjugal transfer protein TraG N-terminal domain-containing protein [Gammaproteobacteria bacterium]|nr:conjugal transfer protein TraG N-terminal domain-containing protein [Gammaproteobacteria bacterium]
MGVSSYFEFVTVLFGWVVYDRLWAVLNDTGIVYLPFLVIVLRNMLESRRAGDDEGSAAIQSLKKSETDVVVAIVVMFLAAVPFTEVRLGEMSYVRPQLDCAVEDRIARGLEPAEVPGTATGTAYDAPLATLSGETGRIPIWWGFVHVVSKAVVAAGTASIPCTGDVVRLSMSLGGDTVGDPLLLREFADFTVDCHRPAVSRMYNGGPNGASAAAREQMDYAGSAFFLDTHGYYNVLYSRRDRPAFPPNPARDSGLDGVHPTCREWWRDGANGLRARLLAEIDPETRDELVYDANALFRAEHPGASVAELEDMLLRKYLAHRSGDRIGVSSVSYEPGVAENYRMGAAGRHGALGGVVHATADVIDDVLSMGAAGLGMVLQGPGNIAAGVAMREGMPIFLALLLMVFVAVLPFSDGVLALRRDRAGDADAGVLRPAVLLRAVGHGVLGRQPPARGAHRAGVGAEGEPHPGAGGAVGAALPLHRLPDGLAGGDRLGRRQGRVGDGRDVEARRQHGARRAVGRRHGGVRGEGRRDQGGQAVTGASELLVAAGEPAVVRPEAALVVLAGRLVRFRAGPRERLVGARQERGQQAPAEARSAAGRGALSLSVVHGVSPKPDAAGE